MGSRASQLKNRQQVQQQQQQQQQASSNPIDILPVADKDALGANGNNNNENNNDPLDCDKNVDVDLDVSRIKDTLNAIGKEILLENGTTGSTLDLVQEHLNNNNIHQQTNGNADSNNLAKVSTLRRQASQIQSLAQRIKRSSSLRAPKLKGLFPTFGKRKVS